MSVPGLPSVPAPKFSPDVSTIKDPAVVAAISSLANAVAAEFAKVGYTNRAQAQALLTSPSGYVFSVTVSDSGAVTAARVRGG